MAHKHSVYDSDTHFSINPVTRVLKNESSAKKSVVQYDHNSERFTFEIPRYIEEHDMLLCNVVQIHYININNQTKEQVCGIYSVDDLQISPDSDDVVICSWLISRNATKLVGSLNFLIRFACVSEGTSETVYVWNTAVQTGISVSSGMYNGEEIADDYADIIQQWEARILALEEDLGMDDVIRHSEQDLTEEQQEQARQNIGAMSADAQFPDELKNPHALTFSGAVDSSYDGSSAVNVEIPTIPEAVKNPKALTFTGAVSGTYDGSKPVSVDIPSVIIDKTLKNEGQAADAKATSEAINSAKAETGQAIESLRKATSDAISALDAEDVGARPNTWMPTASDVGALPSDTQIPTKLPNPNPITFTGAVSGTYDGSAPLTVNVPSGGGSYITVDDAFNPESTNPVQNKVICAFVLEAKETVLQIQNSIPTDEHINGLIDEYLREALGGDY